MSAALQQYQACLGIMVRLRVEDLTALKLDFEQAPGGRGLPLREFVSIMLDRVNSWELDTVVPFIEDLVELFAQVDVNGDGTMEWEEFTGAIIDGGMGSSSAAVGANDDATAEWRDMQYEESIKFVDSAINRPPKRVQFLPEFRRVLLLDNSRPVIELLDPAGLTPDTQDAAASSDGAASFALFEQNPDDNDDADNELAPLNSSSNTFVPQLPIVNKFHPLCYVAGYRRDQDDIRSERSPVQAVKFLDGVDLLVVSAGDLKLTFWAATLLSAASLSALETPVPLAIVHTPRPQRILEWNPATQHLFSISADLLISVWRVIRDKSKCEVRLMSTLKKHTDLLQDLLLLNSETLLSCGMDSVICVWDAVALTPRSTRLGHKRGVRLLTKLSSQMFLSAGFECEVYGWDISPLATTPIFKLWGHNAPVCCMQLISSNSVSLNRQSYSSSESDQSALLANQAITVDDDGWFKWWSLADVLSVESTGGDQDRGVSSSGGNAECLQTFRLGSDKYPWRAHSLAVLHHGQSILAAGLHKLKLLQRVRLKPKVLASSAVLFNSVSLTLLTTTDRELRVWDAASGVLVRTHRNISTADITCMDLDTRQRKIVFGAQNGELTVVSYLNGAVLNRWTPHQLQVSALIYCKEDQCVLTASWDRSVRLYDDNAKSNALLRCVTDAHDGDIKCLAYCHALSVFASGSADGVVKIWDYIYFFLEDTCVPPARTGTSSGHGDVNALEFVDPYPLLLSGHESGLLCVWELSATHPCSLLYSFFPFQMSDIMPPSSNQEKTDSLTTPDALPISRESNISCIRSFFDERSGAVLAQDICRGRFLMVTSNVQGDLSVLDISLLIANSHARAFREENLPSRDDRSYNPRRRFLRQGKNAKRLNKNKSKSSVPLAGSLSSQNASNCHSPQFYEQDVQLLARWRGHQGNVRCLQIVDEPRGILTCSSDKTIKVWGFDGECLGDLSPTTKLQSLKPQQQPDNEIAETSLSHISLPLVATSDVNTASSAKTSNDKPAISGAANETRSWKWEVDSEGAAKLKREHAVRIWDDLKEEKMLALSARRQTMVLARRERRRSRSISLSTSSSAPALIRQLTVANAHPSEGSQVESSDQHQYVEDNVKDEQDINGHAGPLFDQLRGKSTWKLSDLQIARQVARDREREKFRHRMKRIMKSKSRQQQTENVNSTSISNQVDEGDRNSRVIEGVQSLDSTNPFANQSEEGLLPTLDNPTQDLPFADKDNWAVGSLNRERQMYSHLHHENVRRNNKRLAGSSSGLRLRRLETSISEMDLTPSTFLLEKLGTSCVIHENLPLKPAHARSKATKAKSGMAKSQSMTVISSSSKVEDPRSELPRQQTIKDLFQQYDKLFEQQEAEEQDIVQRTADALTRGSSFRPESTGSSKFSSVVEGADTAAVPNVTPDVRAALRKRVGLQSTRRLGGQPKAHRKNKYSKSPKASPRQSDLQKQDRETAAVKKQRLRSDAALMRQERFGPYSREDILNIYRTFRKLDQDQSGSITLQELFGGAGLFSGTHMQDNIASIFSSVDEDQSGQIDLPELCHAVFADASTTELGDIIRLCSLLDAVDRSRKAKKKQLSSDQVKELEALFKVRLVSARNA